MKTVNMMFKHMGHTLMATCIAVRETTVRTMVHDVNDLRLHLQHNENEEEHAVLPQWTLLIMFLYQKYLSCKTSRSRDVLLKPQMQTAHVHRISIMKWATFACGSSSQRRWEAMPNRFHCTRGCALTLAFHDSWPLHSTSITLASQQRQEVFRSCPTRVYGWTR